MNTQEANLTKDLAAIAFIILVLLEPSISNWWVVLGILLF